LAFPAIAQAKKFAGVKLRGAAYQHGFFNILRKYIPEFESADRHDGRPAAVRPFRSTTSRPTWSCLSGGSAWDFCNVTFILAARWVAAGLLANLRRLHGDPSSRRQLEPRRLREGRATAVQDKERQHFGYAWEGGAMLMGISRMDLMKKRGVKPPRTFDELGKVAEAIHGRRTDVTGFVSSNLHHWFLPPYVHGLAATSS
jgi:multiple sugar transport system substrate-binding protein